jgi:regulator of RNase E activity RraA
LGKAQLGACLLLTGDWLFGDRDGLVHVPGDQARLVIKAAAIKDKKERLYKQRMHDGENLITMMNVRAHLSAGEPIKVEF